ncbi:methionine ABC transporter permease protein [Secundilactobacillus silagincola]|uniref:Methionine ABC transporter permease protein n=1 Tax=Secundilactobacillus silagincola TaxID=1714681 RepID=A0A1Z5J4C9_9LACO|nr:methionine ABC transporter permease [Secundilactobacillus silagincola]GAX08940.1 methionine ABC transporter permease protein [Secundilactobacillus silagincola]
MLSKLFPNVALNYNIFQNSIVQTVEMLIITGIISFLISLIIGVLLVVTKKDGIASNPVVWNILDKIINLFRSIPFIILIAALIPLTRVLSGTAIGVKGTIFPLIVGIVPFFSRQIESALNDLDQGLIESGQVMGLSTFQIIKSIYLKESISNISRVTTITFISLIGLTAIVGVVGGGGIGDFAIQYGFQQNEQDATFACIIVLLVIVTIVQIIGTLVSRKTTH